MATRHETTHEITRIMHFIPKPLDSVLAKLQSSIIQTPPNEPAGFSIQSHTSSIGAFETATNKLLGPHGFMQFLTFDHGKWSSLYGVTRRSTRVVFGNPQIAITMLRQDVKAGLFVPVEALLVESEDGKGTEVLMVKPSTLIAGAVDGSGSEGELRKAAEVLDGKVEALWEWVAGGEDE